MTSSYENNGLPVEDFIQALTSQLDRAQSTMAVKARFGLPLTFAVKDISIDLRAHVTMSHNQVLIHPASPDDREASVIHLSLTTITRPMIEENTVQFEPGDVPITSVLNDELDEEEKRRLEWAGIRTVSQLRDLEKQGGQQMIEQVAQIPAMRLRQALQRASKPHISQVERANDGSLRIRGLNLIDEEEPEVRINGEIVPVESASDRELVVMPLAHQLGGMLEVQTTADKVTSRSLDDAVQTWTRSIDDPHSQVQNTWKNSKHQGQQE